MISLCNLCIFPLNHPECAVVCEAITGKALLTAEPGVRCVQLDRTHMSMALMCDGISDVMQDDEAKWKSA